MGREGSILRIKGQPGIGYGSRLAFFAAWKFNVSFPCGDSKRGVYWSYKEYQYHRRLRLRRQGPARWGCPVQWGFPVQRGCPAQWVFPAQWGCPGPPGKKEGSYGYREQNKGKNESG